VTIGQIYLVHECRRGAANIHRFHIRRPVAKLNDRGYTPDGCPRQFLILVLSAAKYKTSHDLVRSWDVCRTALPRSLLDFKIRPGKKRVNGPFGLLWKSWQSIVLTEDSLAPVVKGLPLTVQMRSEIHC